MREQETRHQEKVPIEIGPYLPMSFKKASAGFALLINAAHVCGPLLAG